VTMSNSLKASWRTEDKKSAMRRTFSIGAFRGVTGTSRDPELPKLNKIPLIEINKDSLVSKDPFYRQKKNEIYKCSFEIVPHFRLMLYCSYQDKVIDIKETLLKEAKTRVSDQQILQTSEEYVLKIDGIEEYITGRNESLPLHRVDFIQVCSRAFVTPNFTMIPVNQMKPVDESLRKLALKTELLRGTQIDALIGTGFSSTFLELENDEIAALRRSAIKLQRTTFTENPFSESMNENLKRFHLREYILGEPVPLIVPESLRIQANLPGDIKATVDVRSVERASTLRDMIFNKYKRLAGGIPEDTQAKDFILKVTGYQEYLFDNSQLLSYDHVRRCLSKDHPIELTLVAIKALEGTELEIQEEPESLVNQLLSLDPSENFDNDNENQQLQETLSVVDITDPFQIRIVGIEQITLLPEQLEENCYLFFSIELYHAGHKLGHGFSLQAPASSTAHWNESVVFEDLKYRNIPLGSRILCSLIFRRTDPGAPWIKGIEKNDQILSWIAIQAYDHNYRMIDGCWSFFMWLDSNASPVGSCSQNLLQKEIAPKVNIQFYGSHSSKKRIVYQLSETSRSGSSLVCTNSMTESRLNVVINADPLEPLSQEDKMLIWGNRVYLATNPLALSKFLLSVRWDDPMQVREAHRMLRIWAKPSPLVALELLDAKFPDPIVRDYGTSCLDLMLDGECYDFMLQLTQVLKHEPYHDSALARFLLKRAWGNWKIGYSFFWFLKSEMHLADVAERFTVLLASFLRGCGPLLKELVKQNDVNSQLVRVAEKVKLAPGPERKRVLLSGLESLELPESFLLPLDERVKVSELRVDKCKYMDSKKLPLWLVWKNLEPQAKPVSVIFKVGDDLRQDVLTLQIIRIFDKLWKNEGMDLLLKPYGCIATGDDIGMIEVVKNADTTANINKAAGGTKAVLQNQTLTLWLKSHNPTPEAWAKAQDTFALSCAGYCVATFVLGIGDRHNDNIMLTHEGNLFHIDFGHFLGNYKKKYGFKRERAPFIFTPQYAHVLDGKNSEPFKRYIDLCGKAYNILRRHKDVFINLFQMMLCTGIPELGSPEDIEYLRDAFAVGKTDEEAAAYFKKLIFSSLNTKTTIINDAIHVFVHSGKDKSKKEN